MGIKVGDIVEYQGRVYRVLSCLGNSKKRFHLFSSFNNVSVYESDVKLGDGQDFQIYHLEKISDYDIV